MKFFEGYHKEGTDETIRHLCCGSLVYFYLFSCIFVYFHFICSTLGGGKAPPTKFAYYAQIFPGVIVVFRKVGGSGTHPKLEAHGAGERGIIADHWWEGLLPRFFSVTWPSSRQTQKSTN